MPVGKGIFLIVRDFNFLKLHFTAIADAISSPHPSIGIIAPDHSERHFKIVMTLGTDEGQ